MTVEKKRGDEKKQSVTGRNGNGVVRGQRIKWLEHVMGIREGKI